MRNEDGEQETGEEKGERNVDERVVCFTHLRLGHKVPVIVGISVEGRKQAGNLDSWVAHAVCASFNEQNVFIGMLT